MYLCPTSRLTAITPKITVIVLWCHCLPPPSNFELLQSTVQWVSLTAASLALTIGPGIIYWMNEWMNDLKEWRVLTTQQKSGPRQNWCSSDFTALVTEWGLSRLPIFPHLLGPFQLSPVVPVKLLQHHLSLSHTFPLDVKSVVNLKRGNPVLSVLTTYQMPALHTLGHLSQNHLLWVSLCPFYR